MMKLPSWLRIFESPEIVKVNAEPEEIVRSRSDQYARVIDALVRYQKPKAFDGRNPESIQFPVGSYVPPKGVVPPSHSQYLKDCTMAMDGMITNFAGAQAQFFSTVGFPGFPFLTELTQISEYRDLADRVPAEMTRKWIKLRSKSNKKDKSDRIKKIENKLCELHARDIFRQAAVYDNYFGRCQIFIDMGFSEGSELETPLILSPGKIKKGSLRKLKIIEPITTYPAAYNGSNPLRDDYYKPDQWFIYGQKVHDSRLLWFNSRPLPDLLKPVYNFAGMSLSQLAQPYVDNWLTTRESVGKLLRNFAIISLSTDLDTMSADPEEFIRRIKLFTEAKDNHDIMLLNNGQGEGGEKINQVVTPLSGLDKLQAQAQEHMAAVAKTPLIVLLGISPTGLNPSSEGEMEAFYNFINDTQESIFRQPLEFLIKVIQLSEFGDMDEDITFNFVSLEPMNPKELSEIRKSDADAALIYMQTGAVQPEDIHDKIANDPDSGWDNLGKFEPPPEPEQPEDGDQIGEIKKLEK